MGPQLVTPPAATIVSLEEVKLIAHLLDTTFDSLLYDYISAAQSQIETAMGRSLAPQTWKLYLDAFSPEIVLPRGPVTAVSSVKYLDAAGVQQTASATLYATDLVGDPQAVVLKSGQSWPVTLDQRNAVEVTYNAGFTNTDLPAYKAAQTAVRALALHWYENGGIGTLPDGVRALIFPYTAHGF